MPKSAPKSDKPKQRDMNKLETCAFGQGTSGSVLITAPLWVPGTRARLRCAANCCSQAPKALVKSTSLATQHWAEHALTRPLGTLHSLVSKSSSLI